MEAPAVAIAPGPLWPWQRELGGATLSTNTGLVGGSVRSSRGPRRPTSLLQAVGATIMVEKATFLVGMSRGEQKSIGTFRWQGELQQFDWWFPHLGIAVDEAPEAEIAQNFDRYEARREWCAEHSIIYTTLPTTSRLDPAGQFIRQEMLDRLREAADERRRQLEE